MTIEYLITKKIPTLVGNSLELAQRIDDANTYRIVDLALTKPTMPVKDYKLKKDNFEGSYS